MLWRVWAWVGGFSLFFISWIGPTKPSLICVQYLLLSYSFLLFSFLFFFHLCPSPSFHSDRHFRIFSILCFPPLSPLICKQSRSYGPMHTPVHYQRRQLHPPRAPVLTEYTATLAHLVRPGRLVNSQQSTISFLHAFIYLSAYRSIDPLIPLHVLRILLFLLSPICCWF